MTMRFGLTAALAAMLALGVAPASGQTGMADPDSGQVAGLFLQSCMKYAGNAAGLREWVSAHRLPQIPADQAATFLGSLGAGEAYGASNASGKHALVSYDSGACRVLALSGDASDIQQTLLALLRGQGVTVVPVLARAKPDSSSSQGLFEATFGPRHWRVSITAKPHAEAPSTAPEVGVLATVG